MPCRSWQPKPLSTNSIMVQAIPKTWVGSAKVLKIIDRRFDETFPKEKRQWYVYVMVIDDPDGNEELLQGMCFLRDGMNHGWMPGNVKVGDVIAVTLPSVKGSKEPLMYAAGNQHQPSKFKPSIREFVERGLEEGWRQEQELKEKRKQNAEALKAHKVKETVVQQTAIQQTSLPFHQAIEDQCSVGIKFSLKPRQVAAIAPVAQSLGFDLSNQNWKGKFIGACLRNEIPGALEALAKALSAT